MGWYESFVDGIESVGRGIDSFVIKSIDVVGGGADDLIDYVKENPGKSVVIAATTIATGGAVLVAAPAIGAAAGVAGAVGGTFGGVAAGSVGLAAGVGANSILGVAASEGFRGAFIVSAELTAKEAALYTAAGFVAKELKDHIVDNYIRENVYSGPLRQDNNASSLRG